MAEETVDTPVTEETIDTPITEKTVDIPVTTETIDISVTTETLLNRVTEKTVDSSVTEETVDSLVTPETIDIPVSVETVAIPPLKKTQLEDGHEKSHSTENLGMLFNGTRVLPRYLTGSPGSCHDFCKYGARHESETMPMSPKPRRIKARPSEGKYMAKTVNSMQKEKNSVLSPKKKSPINPKPFHDSNTQTPDKNRVTKKEVTASAKKAVVSSEHVSSPKKAAVSSKHVSSPKKAVVSSKHVSSPRKGVDASTEVASDEKPKRLLTKSSSLPNPKHLSTKRYIDLIIPKGGESPKMSPLGVSSNRRKSGIGEINKEETPRTRKEMVSMQQTVPSSPKSKQQTVPSSPKSTVNRIMRQKSDDYRNLRKVALLKNQHSGRKTETEKPIDGTVPEKTLYVVETKPDNPTVELALSNIRVAHSYISSEDESLGYSEDEIWGQTETGVCAFQPSSPSSPSSRNRSFRRTKSATPKAMSPSLSLLSSSLSELSGTKSENQTEKQKVENKSRSRRVTRASSEDRDHSPRKLNFRKGKLVDDHHENNDPRKLKFRQGEVLGENQNGMADTKRRTLRRAVSDVKAHVTKAETVEVVLRHQDMEEKKDVQNLLNEVIEETASKLLQARKSKVKSLVGAFETVISLQDTKSSATTWSN